jgi:hypothetical protein
MPFLKYFIPIAAITLVAASYYFYGWQGLLVTTGGLIMWILLHFTRALQVLKRATNRPIGHVASAVMLNAKLKPGASLLHVIALTKSLGAQQSAKDAQPEVFRWTDTGLSHVTCTFVGGKLTAWELVRPRQEPAP